MWHKKFDVKTECNRPFRKQGYQHESNIKIGDKNWIRWSVVAPSGSEYDLGTGLCESDKNVWLPLKGKYFFIGVMNCFWAGRLIAELDIIIKSFLRCLLCLLVVGLVMRLLDLFWVINCFLNIFIVLLHFLVLCGLYLFFYLWCFFWSFGVMLG